MKKALIFDFDGLIVDTESTEYRSFYELGKQFGINLAIDKWQSWVGTVGGRVRALAYFCEQIGDVDKHKLPEIERLFEEEFDAQIARQDLQPGVREIIADASRMGLKLAIASSSDYEWVSHFLKKFNLIHFFHHIQTRDNVTHVKPHPEIYLKALEQLQIQASEAIAFEDSVVGSLAAKAAGIPCLVIPNLVTRSLDFSHADAKYDSLSDVPLTTWVQK